MVEKIAIVGNGLDLHHEIKSSFKDFFKSSYMDEELKKEYCEVVKNDVLSSNWYSFEEKYKNLISEELKSAQNNCYGTGELGLGEKNFPILYDYASAINEIFDKIKNSFLLYLDNEYDSRKKSFRVDGNVKRVLLEQDRIITFNYTNLLEECYCIPEDIVIHVHGKIEDNPIFGHSIYCGDKNYALHMNIPRLKESVYKGDKHIQRLESWNGSLKLEDNSFTTLGNVDVSDNPILNKINIRMLNNNSKSSFNLLDFSFNNPFSALVDSKNGINYKNKLELDFSDELDITIIGHGLMSDSDLLSKIEVKNKKVYVFQRKENMDYELMDRAKKIFRVNRIYDRYYEWD